MRIIVIFMMLAVAAINASTMLGAMGAGRETELSLLLTLFDGTGDKRKTEGVLEVVLLSLVRGCVVTLRVPLADIA